MKKTLWIPSQSYRSNAVLSHYQSYVQTETGQQFTAYADLYNWSIEHLDIFWESILHYFPIRFSGTYSKALLWNSTADDFIGAKWFEGISLSYSEHIFADRTAQDTALYYEDERNKYIEVSWTSLAEQVSSVQQFLVHKGIKKGDRVAGILSNNVEAIVIFLAVNSLGAIWTCCSPDFGDKSIIERLSIIAPSLLFIEQSYQYNGRQFSKVGMSPQLKAQLNTLKGIVFVGSNEWTDLFSTYIAQPLHFERVPFDHPIWILYSSGTTGKPKAIVHGTGGILLEHFKALAIHQNVQKGERFLWYTTTGWMMWNYALSSLLCGASLCLYDGAIAYNEHRNFWNFVKKVAVDHLGAGASYFASIHGLSISGYQPKVVGSTGSALSAVSFEDLQQKFPQAHIISLSGGTDVCSAFLSGCAWLPVYAGTIQCRSLGAAIVAMDETGKELLDEVGELIIKKPMPSMPVFFWDDPAHQKYRESYFTAKSGCWSHGDWISIAEDGTVTMQGRSDATLNRGGVRIGTAEIYNAVQTVPGISDCLVISTEDRGGPSRMILFVQLEEEQNLGVLVPLIKETLKSQYSPRHVPDLFYEVPDIPYTLSGKKLEIPIKKLFSGILAAHVVSGDIMRNPQSLLAFEAIYKSL